MKKSKGKGKAKKAPPVIAVTLSETAAGVAWLRTLGEPAFRDEILAHLFARMKRKAAIEDFLNVHGRNDKGIDYLVVEATKLQRRIVGIQVKSKDITRTGDSASLSSLNVKRESEASLAHEYILRGDRVRLDNIAVWSSAHITEDAEKEFYAPGSLAKVQVVKSPAVFALINEFSPELLEKIPQCAISLYLREKAQPVPKPIKLLGANLDPKNHFLIPQLSRKAASSSARLRTRNKVIAPAKDSVDVDYFLHTAKHGVINGPDLSGKTYLLEHMQALAADTGALPFLLNPEQLVPKARTIFHVLSKVLPSFSPHDLANLSTANRIILFVDDIDELSEADRSALYALNPQEVTVIGTGRSMSAPDHVEQFFIVGVDFDSIPHFLRSLDASGKGMVFTDRAHSFISRSLVNSGLPESPFTVAMLLQECQLSSTKFTTPTMGRLIERFIELQLGSHSDNTVLVDFESKREFLTRLAGKPEVSLDQQELQRLLSRHIHARSLPHTADLFYADLLNSGVFTHDEKRKCVTWSHPIIKQFFWVKNLIAKGKLPLIERTLREKPDTTLAAIAGSQLKDGGQLIDKLVTDLLRVKGPSTEDLVKTVREMAPDILPTDESEAKMLDRIEQLASDKRLRQEERKKIETVTSEYSLTDDDRARVEKQIGPILQRLIESKLHIGQNLASVVVNARDTKAPQKEKAVKQILLSNARFGRFLHEVILLLYEGRPRVLQMASWLRIYMTLGHTDAVLGDPFLLTVFKDLLRTKLDDDSRVMLIDLILGCGEDDHELILDVLKRTDKPELTYAIYYRVTALYFFRFHREAEKKRLRRLLGELRRIHPFAQLPTVPST